MIGMWNLWFFFAIGYGVIWTSMIVANRKRGVPIEDPALYKSHGKKIPVIGWTWFTVVFVTSLFVPVDFGFLFWIGLPLYLLGTILNTAAICSFAQFRGGVNATGIYRYSRNPMYIGGFFFLLGLCLMGLAALAWSIAFVILFVLSIPYYHWMVLLEEVFLEHKYGEEYMRYKQNVPRYLSVGKKKCAL